MKNITYYFFIIILMGCKTTTEERIETTGYFQNKCSFIKRTNIKHGNCMQFDSNGDTISKFNYIKGKLDGLQYFFNSNGTYESILTYKKNVKSGEVRNFYDNGNLKSVVMYKKGLLWNIIELKDINGNILHPGDFKNGNGLVIIYYDNGEIEYKGQYFKGKPNGEWVYITDTRNEEIKVYNNGLDSDGYKIVFY